MLRKKKITSPQNTNFVIETPLRDKLIPIAGKGFVRALQKKGKLLEGMVLIWWYYYYLYYIIPFSLLYPTSAQFEQHFQATAYFYSKLSTMIPQNYRLEIDFVPKTY
eukprot:TRINITY_DN5683_c0_g1_i2.p3 TRINITY_DN5683_c0_g1~~TRINITY_DN5683_c0_g1_i2.p3  ORF type:complete len:107 (+),score=6.90 TRINITY_DN5683_c0_g1_i2:61-381(+)